MDQQQQDWKKEKDSIEQLFDVLGFLYKWGSDHPLEAQSFAAELREMMMRYLLEDDDLDTIVLPVYVSLDLWKRFLQCLNAERADVLLARAMEAEIVKHKGEKEQ